MRMTLFSTKIKRLKEVRKLDEDELWTDILYSPKGSRDPVPKAVGKNVEHQLVINGQNSTLNTELLSGWMVRV